MSFIENQKPLRTWSHLSGGRKKPSEYDVVSRKLHYSTNNPDAPWELSPTSPMNEWYKKYRNNSALQNPCWDDFTDPDGLVYRTYNLMQDGQESHVMSLFDQFDEREHDFQLDSDWIKLLSEVYTPLKYVFHGLQMSSAYLAQMAPASTITNCATFQSADFLRLTTHTAYRTFELSEKFTGMGFGDNERGVWEESDNFQSFRLLIEKNLVAFDWADSFVSLCLVAIPAVVEGVLKPLSNASQENSDVLLSLLIDSQLKDLERHLRWARELVKFACNDNSQAKIVIVSKLENWKYIGEEAVSDYVGSISGSIETKFEAVKNYNELIRSIID
ncbi:ferritin family protein [Zhongshania marina]|uniref:Toluene monooxygenase n=1 Tax=Zhongshania marina TaxID=2304603 RepID=A0ABX9VXS1_9GAMM|nr:toluene monooxygenase [Zhongshania marina]|tara:strand:- start:8685 stop:9674 length:990 start_codon:yes stop_codon:yes gene_type:complete